ncbi:hypothetical protein CTAYLR_000790 [Chrysophaeum taylorii]|uniref:Uncharacterized protein n=1 Tax=Chrysophaeum taylorii TaxID=2483200 RepID=A0AAD7XNS9_9STRA|nr:hypothetical protein CTAYLR_000790 [Chrysophaeum taylorii]
MARSLHVEWPNATSKEKQNTSWPCMYELQVADLIAGMDGDVAQFRTVYRGSRRDAVVHGLVPLRNYTLRIRATMLFADDYDGDASIETTGPSVQLRTLSGPVFGFDRGSRGESINVSDDGLVATYTGNEAWSMILGDEPLVAGCNQWEVRIDESPTSCIFVGVATRFADTTTFLGGDEHSWGYIGDRALYHKRMKVKVYGERYGMGDVIGVTLDMNHGMLSFSKNGFDLGIAFDGLAGELFPAIAFYNRGQQVSIKTSSYRCPGIGDVIPRLQKRYFGIDELQEYTLLMRSLYGSREKPGRVPATWRQRAFVWYRAWHAGITARHPTFTGADIFVDTSKDACRHFGTAEVLYTLNEHVKAAFPFVGGTVDDDEFRRSERSCFSFAEEAQQQQDLLNALLQNHHHFRAEEKSVSLRECFHSLAKQVEDDYDYPEDLPQVSLNRLTTMASRSRGEPDTKLAQSMFGQLCDRLHFLEPRLLRMGYTHPMDDAQERTFKVKFEGEGVDDYGGPFREIFVQVPLELQDVEGTRCKLPLFLPIEDSTKFVPVPRSPCRAHREMYAFIGKLIGVSLRCKVTMQFNFPSRIWKALLNQALDLDDIAAMAQDVLTEVGHALDEIADRSAETTGLFWTTTLSDGTEIDLRPRGHSQLVSVSETEEYIRVAIAARLNENYEALIAMRAGFESIIPAPVLQVYTGAELEKLVCGVQSVDLDLLRRNTDYDDDVHPDDPHIQYFWEALHSFDEHDRSAFLRFVWARTRLPASQMDFHQKFKIQSAVGDGPARDPDSYLPKCHTCFFSINLPRYSSVEIMAARLKFAIHNCVEMDADFRLADNELVRWFDVD